MQINNLLNKLEKSLDRKGDMCYNCEHTAYMKSSYEENQKRINELMLKMLPDVDAYNQWRESLDN